MRTCVRSSCRLRIESHPPLSSPGLTGGTQYAAAFRLKHGRPWNTGSPGTSRAMTSSKAVRARLLNRFPRIRHRRGEAAVDREGLAVDVGCLVAREVQPHRRDLV